MCHRFGLAFATIAALLSVPMAKAVEQSSRQTVYTCPLASGGIEYTTVKRVGCKVLFEYSPATSSAVGPSFHGHSCSSNCTGHEAGYNWAQKKSIHSVARCGKKTGSFFDGCRIYAAEHPGAESTAIKHPVAIATNNYASSCPNDNDECQQACDAADALKDAAEALASCAENEDLNDDCTTEFNDVDSAHSDYEDAVANAGGECD